MEEYNNEDRVDHRSAAGIIRDADGRILVLRHVKHQCLSLPVGKCKPGESPLQGLCTEMREELGIEVLDASEVATFQKSYDFTGKPVNVDMHVFRINSYAGEIRNMEPAKCAGLLWTTEGDLQASTEKFADCLKVVLSLA